MRTYAGKNSTVEEYYPSVTNPSREVKASVLIKEIMKEKISYERRDYEALANAPKCKTIGRENVANIMFGR